MSLTGAAHWTQQFNKTDGTPYSGVRVYHYEPGGTTTDRTVWSDEAATTTAAQPVVGDTKGRVSFYGKGNYRLLVKTSVADGDATLYDFDPVKLEDQPPGLRGELQATSYPSATSANRGLMFFKKNVGGDVTEVGVNLDASGFTPIRFQGTAITTTESWAKGANLASASTLTLGSDGNFFDVTGTTGITAISAKAAGTVILLRAITGFTISYNATSMILWNAQDFTMGANDVIVLVSNGSGNWIEVARKSNNFLDEAQMIQNGTLAVSLAGNACTVALKTKAGTDPSSSDPVRVAFRNATLTSGVYVIRTITSALSVTISSGSTLGTTSTVAHRIYAALMDNAGTVEMAVWNPYTTSGLVGFSESELFSTTAEGGAGAADTAGVAYSTTSRSSLPMRVLGFFESTQATAGTWVTTPSRIQTMGKGVPRTGQTIQRLHKMVTGMTTGTTQIPFDNTIPQNTEGDEYMSDSITPRSSMNVLHVKAVGYFGSSAGGGNMALALFQDSTADALKTAALEFDTSAKFMYIGVEHRMLAGTTSSTTFKARAGANTAGTTTFNGLGGSAYFGGTMGSFISIEEIFA